MIVEITYLLYLLISIAITIWVGNTLSKNGLVFLIDGFGGKEALARSINHMLLVGFYLVNIGFVNIALKHGRKPIDAQTAIEFLSTKIGLVLIVLGAMHLINVILINNFRSKFKKNRNIEIALEQRAMNTNNKSFPG